MKSTLIEDEYYERSISNYGQYSESYDAFIKTNNIAPLLPKHQTKEWKSSELLKKQIKQNTCPGCILL